MRFNLRMVGIVMVLVLLSGCVAQKTKAPFSQANTGHYYGPKAVITVTPFKVVTGRFGERVNLTRDMSEYLSAELVRSNRFLASANTSLKQGLVVRPTVVEFSGGAQNSQGQLTNDVIGVAGALMGAVANSGDSLSTDEAMATAGVLVGAVADSLSSAHMVVDLQLIDARTSRVIATTRLRGESSGADLVKLMSGDLGATLSDWKGTASDQAFKQVIQQAVEFISMNTPQRFYHEPRKSSVRAMGPPRAAVKEMQSLLNKLGYDVGVADGLAGKVTRRAVLAFQTDSGLSATGRYNKSTVALLRKQTTAVLAVDNSGVDLDSLLIGSDEVSGIDLDSL